MSHFLATARTVRILLVSSLLSFAGFGDAQETVDVPRLFGIASLLVKDDSIEVTRDDGLPSGLDLRKAGTRVERASIRIGETFEVTDGHHLGHKFKLIAIEKGAAKLETTDWTAFLGREPDSSTSTTAVRSYVTRRKRQGP